MRYSIRGEISSGCARRPSGVEVEDCGDARQRDHGRLDAAYAP
jgi:hypothetical protein